MMKTDAPGLSARCETHPSVEGTTDEGVVDSVDESYHGCQEPNPTLALRLQAVGLLMSQEQPDGTCLGYLLDQALPDLPGWCVLCHWPCFLVLPLCLECALAAGPAGERLRNWPKWLRLLARSRMGLVDRLRGHTRTEDLYLDFEEDPRNEG